MQSYTFAYSFLTPLQFLDPRSPSQHSGLGSAPTAKQGQREGAAKAAASSLLHECDDMLHFVYDAAKPSGPQIQVRRRAGQVVAALPPELHIGGAHYARVAWKDTLLLNLVLQAVYFLTIVVCRLVPRHWRANACIA